MIILPQPLSWVELTTRIETADIHKLGRFNGDTPIYAVGKVYGQPVKLGLHNVTTLTHGLHTEVHLHICPTGDVSC